MKVFLKSTFAALMICALASIAAAAKDKVKTESVTFTQDTMVNGTLVKAGDYQVKFNEQTGEMNIMRGSKVVARATAHVETQSARSKATEYRIVANELVSVTLGGSNKQLVLSSSSTSGSQ